MGRGATGTGLGVIGIGGESAFAVPAPPAAACGENSQNAPSVSGMIWGESACLYHTTAAAVAGFRSPYVLVQA